MAEWLKAPHLKCGMRETVSEVRILPSPLCAGKNCWSNVLKKMNSPEEPKSFDNSENLDFGKEPKEIEKLDSETEAESRYKPGEYRIEISVDVAREDIEKNFPDVKVERIEYLGEGMGNTAFLVNGEFIFRFAKNEKADASIEKEIKALPEIQKRIDLPVPNFEYTGRQRNQFRVIGYKRVGGESLEKSDLVSPEGKVDEELTSQLATFFKQLHSIDVTTAKSWGLPKRNFRSQYENELQDARDRIYSLVEQTYPAEAELIKDYIEKLFAGYLDNRENFEYKPAVLHGDLEAEHIIFDQQSRKITGIIDWGGMRIGDPDYDLFRPYSHYGSEFIEEFLKHYPHPDPEHLRQKLDFFFRAQMIHRTVRPIILGDQEEARWHLDRLKKQALGQGYWYNELREG